LVELGERDSKQFYLFLFPNLFREDLMNENLLTIDELAEKLKVAKSWLYSRTREKEPGAIPRIKVGKYIRFVESDVMDWLKGKQSLNNA